MKYVTLTLLSVLLAFSAYAQQGPAAKKGGAQPGQIRGPCAEDAAKFCKDVEPGAGRIVGCLEANADKLTPACKTQVDRAKQRQQARARKAGPAAKAQSGKPQAAQPAQPAQPDATKK